MSQIIDLTLDGLSCGHCVKRVKESRTAPGCGTSGCVYH